IAWTSSGCRPQNSAIWSKVSEVFSTSQTAVAFGINGTGIAKILNKSGANSAFVQDIMVRPSRGKPNASGEGRGRRGSGAAAAAAETKGPDAAWHRRTRGIHRRAGSRNRPRPRRNRCQAEAAQRRRSAVQALASPPVVPEATTPSPFDGEGLIV